MNKQFLTFVIFVSFVVSAILAAPAWAQKDAVKIDEKLATAVIKKADSKEVKPAKAMPDPVKGREVLEIETKRGVKQ